MGPVQAVIGVVDGEPRSEVFGSIADIEVDTNGNLYIVDEFDSNVRVFDSSGSFLGLAGRAGEGPGEFRDGGRIRVASEAGGLLHVLDGGNARMHALELTDTGLVFTDDVRLDVAALEICVVQGRRYLLVDPLAANTGPLIREVDARGRVVNAFGEREKPDGVFSAMGGWDYFVNYSLLACNSATETMVLVSQMLPVIRAFSPDGEELWRRILTAFHQQRVELVTEGPGAGSCCKYAIPDPESGTYHMATAVAIDGTHVFVSLTEVPDESQERLHELRILDAKTGLQVARYEAGVPIADVNGTLIYTYTDEPFPQVIIRRKTAQWLPWFISSS
jgi:hypothetical protein